MQKKGTIIASIMVQSSDHRRLQQNRLLNQKHSLMKLSLLLLQATIIVKFTSTKENQTQ